MKPDFLELVHSLGSPMKVRRAIYDHVTKGTVPDGVPPDWDWNEIESRYHGRDWHQTFMLEDAIKDLIATLATIRQNQSPPPPATS